MHISHLPKIFKPFHTELIRVGKDNDGGYLISQDDVDRTDVLVSLGVGTDWSFEQQFTSMNNCRAVAYDRDAAPEADEFYIGNRKLYRQHIGTNLSCLPFSEVLTYDNIFLKCDIEGSEYEILDDIINSSDKFTGMVIEFHTLSNPSNFDDLTNFISKIKQRLVHIHANNYMYFTDGVSSRPDVIELTFSTSASVYVPHITLPHTLDMPNNPLDSDFMLTFSK